MPELPEIETIKRGLQKSIVGKKIANVKVLRKKNFKGDKNKIIGKYVVGVHRRAKYLIIGLSKRPAKCGAITNSSPITNHHSLITKSSVFLICHMKMTGQLIFRTKNIEPGTLEKNKNTKNKKSPYDVKKLPNKYTRVIIEFEDDSHLYFNNLRAFGYIKVAQISNIKALISNLGPEPFSDEFTTDYLKEQFSKTSRAVKLVLMDQKVISGIGNIYANEILFCAKIDPRRKAKDTKISDIKILEKCTIKILKQAIKHQGSTAKDDAFRNIKGKRGKMQDHLKVYGREGKKCPNCKGKVKKIKLGGRGTYFCPNCQS